MLKAVRHFIEGMVLGSANVIPGVSGGSMALIFGIYEALVDAISQGFSAVIALVRFDVKKATHLLKTLNWGLVLPLGVGVVASILTGARFIPVLLETYPEQSRGLFFGLIIASVALPWIRIREHGPHIIIAAIIGAVAAFVLSGLGGGEISDPSLVLVFLAGALAITTMILPGVSGSHVLLVLGLYSATLSAIDQRELVYIAVFGLGAGLGLGLFSKLLKWLLEHYHDTTMAVLVGLMIGSLRALWPWLNEADNALRLPAAGDPIAAVIGLAVLGFGVVAALTWWSVRQGFAE